MQELVHAVTRLAAIAHLGPSFTLAEHGNSSAPGNAGDDSGGRDWLRAQVQGILGDNRSGAFAIRPIGIVGGFRGAAVGELQELVHAVTGLAAIAHLGPSFTLAEHGNSSAPGNAGDNSGRRDWLRAQVQGVFSNNDGGRLVRVRPVGVFGLARVFGGLVGELQELVHAVTRLAAIAHLGPSFTLAEHGNSSAPGNAGDDSGGRDWLRAQVQGILGDNRSGAFAIRPIGIVGGFRGAAVGELQELVHAVTGLAAIAHLGPSFTLAEHGNSSAPGNAGDNSGRRDWLRAQVQGVFSNNDGGRLVRVRPVGVFGLARVFGGLVGELQELVHAVANVNVKLGIIDFFQINYQRPSIAPFDHRDGFAPEHGGDNASGSRGSLAQIERLLGDNGGRNFFTTPAGLIGNLNGFFVQAQILAHSKAGKYLHLCGAGLLGINH